MRKIMYILALSLTVGLCGSVLAQETEQAHDRSTINQPGVHLIPGTKPNPLATPDSLPGQGGAKVLLQPYVEMTSTYDHGMNDNASYSMTLIDLLEYRPNGSDSDVHWDIEHWQGGDYKRWWIKTEGERKIHSGDYHAEFQLLRSKLIDPFTEFQYGLSLQTKGHDGSHIARPQLAVGIHSLMPYKYELDAALFIDAHGHISGDIKAEKDFKITQQLILQPRLEIGAALQQVDRFGIGSGLTDASLGLRLRYEIRREFAPYVGVVYQKSFGKTASFVRQQGGDPSQWRFVAGVRMWF